MTNKITELSQRLGARCLEEGAVCATAESCTGGMVASAITDIAGSSAWFDRGFVTYTNTAKMQMLGVSELSLTEFGAVSESVVREMAAGALLNSDATLSVSISGVAGPSGGSTEKPVGTVCFAWSRQTDKNVYTCTEYLPGDRQQVRLKAVALALEGLIALLDGTITNTIRS